MRSDQVPASVTLLGGFAFLLDGAPVDLSMGLSSGIVARLALEPGRVIPGDVLIAELWEEPTEAALNTLRSQVSRLRSGALGSVLQGGRAGYSLAVPESAVDVSRLRALAASADAAVLADAETLWHDELLPRFERFPFVARERAALVEYARSAGLRLADQRIAAGDLDAAIPALERIVQRSPLHERPLLLLATALSKAGRPSEALAAIDGLRRRLREAEGLDLPPASEQLRASIVRRDAAIAETSLVDVERHGVTVPLTQLVGRREELDAIEAARLEARVVTLVGPGGVGKTRLAMESARRSPRTGDEVQWVVELADLSGADVLAAVADVIGSPDGDAEAVARQLGTRRTLLVLDNAEHLREQVAAFLLDMLPRVDGLAALVTSREALHLPGERVVAIRAWDEGVLDDAVALFIDRVRDVLPDFEPTTAELDSIRSICRRVDGLPLGIELVAGLADVLDIPALEESVDRGAVQLESGRAIGRHRSLGSVIGWSFGLLSEREKALLVQLSGFAGTFSLDTVAGICRVDGDARRLTAGLAQKSLVSVTVAADGARRYRLLESVREFAAALADPAERAAWLDRHARWHAERLDALRDALRGPDETALQITLEAGRPDFHLALDTAIEAGDRDLALRLVGGLAWHWFRRSSLPEGGLWMSRALAVPGDADPATEAWAYAGAVMFAFQSAPREQLYATIADGLRAAERTDDEAVRQLLRGYERYCDSLLRPEKLPRYAGYELPDLSAFPGWVQGELLSMHGQLLRALGRPSQALETLGHAQEVCARVGHRWCQGSTLYLSGKILIDLKRGREAARVARRGILLAAKGPSATSALSHVEIMAAACAFLERHRDGAMLFGAHDRLAEQYGLLFDDADEPQRRLVLRQGLTQAEWDEWYGRGRRMAYSRAIEFALSIAPPEER